MKYIGIDLGSSFLKAVLIDVDNSKILKHISKPAPLKEKSDNVNVFEISASMMVEIVKNLISEFTSQYKDIDGVILSTQMHGFIYSVPGFEDRYISWQDMRVLDKMPGTPKTYLEYLSELIFPEDMKNNGLYIKPSMGLCNLYTLFSQNPSIPRDGTFYTLGSYVIHALSGNNIAHIQNAAPCGFADVAHHCIDPKIIRTLGFESVHFPEIAESDYQVCGVYVSNDVSIKIYPDYGDMQISILGCDIEDGDVVINTSTGSQVIRYSTDFKPGQYEIRPFFDESYLYTISNMPAGRNLAVLVNFFGEVVSELTGQMIDIQKIWEYIHSHKANLDEDLLVEANFYKNPYFPDGGRFMGVTQNNLHIDTIIAAAFQNMVETYWNFIQKLGEKPEKIKEIVCAGGVNWKTPELCEAIGKVSGKPWRLSTMENEAEAGLFRLALVCSGKYSTIQESMQEKIILH